MAYSSSNPIALYVDGLLPLQPRTFVYSSSHNSTDVLATGFFTGVGDGSRGLTDLGMRVGDLLINRASTAAAIPGRVSFHSCISSTANQASTSASTGWVAAYDCTVSQSS